MCRIREDRARTRNRLLEIVAYWKPAELRKTEARNRLLRVKRRAKCSTGAQNSDEGHGKFGHREVFRFSTKGRQSEIRLVRMRHRNVRSAVVIVRIVGADAFLPVPFGA